MKAHRRLNCAILLGSSLMLAPRAWAESSIVPTTSTPVEIGIHGDDPRLKFVIVRPSLGDDPAYEQVVWQGSGTSRVSLLPGRYRLRSTSPPGTGGGTVDHDLRLVEGADFQVTSPSASARHWGMGIGIGGSIVAGVSAFVLFAGAWGYIAGDCFGSDCKRLSHQDKVFAGALLGAVAVGGTAGALGFRAYFRNRYPRVTVVPPEAKSGSDRTLSFGPARIGDGWGMSGAGMF